MKKGTIIFNKDLTTIGKEAFKDCENLASITIHKKVNSILANAFQNCMNLNELYYKGVKDDFTKIKLDSNWLNESSIKYVHCEDESINVGCNYLTFTALEDGEIGFYVNEYNKVQPTIEYSFDKINWHTFINEEFVTVLKDQNIYCRGLNPNGINEKNAWSGDTVNGFYQNSGRWNVSGNIMTLIDYINPITEIVGEFSYLFGNDEDKSKNLPNGERLVNIINASKLELPATTLAYCYRGMFENCTSLTTAPELPATTLAAYCYSNMFNGCTSLTTAPELPATTLAHWCYINMFQGCTSLTTAPELPATTLASYCYDSMFYGCTSLTTAPELPATKLTPNCYQYMFSGCTSLTTAPELPATELTNGCYQGMFSGCTSLNEIKCLATNIPATNCTYRWVYNVSPTGTFIKHPDATTWSTGNSGIPSGWDIIEIEMPYVTFAAQQDNSSIGLVKLSTNQTLEYSTDTTEWNTFDENTNISLNNGDKVYIRGFLSTDNTPSNYTQFEMTGKLASYGNCNTIWNYLDFNAPLKQYCGYKMFYNCISLAAAPKLPATTLDAYCYNSMFNRCTSLTTAPELPATTLADYCYGSMFGSCTSLTTAPELPATTLAAYCYDSMFYNCTSIAAVPELPATTLAAYCYNSMFLNCTSLVTAPELPATTLADYCYGSMFVNCSSLTTAPELPATTLTNSCYNNMFYNCSNINYIKCLATDISAAYCTYNWVAGVSNTGTFYKHPEATWSTGNSGIPSDWEVVDAEI